jgi:hypothetical protein
MNLIYSAIYKDYDLINEQPSQEDTDFIMFHDKRFESKTWKIFETKSETGNMDAKWWKLHPPTGYDMTIWIDGAIEVKPNFIEEIKRQMGDSKYGIQKHPIRDCVYEEEKASPDGKYIKERLKHQVYSYMEDGLPPHNGLTWNCILVRQGDTTEFDSMWWNEIEKWSIQDQLSSPYVQWKLNYPIKILDLKEFVWHHHR